MVTTSINSIPSSMTVRRALVAGLALAAGVASAADTCSTPAETLVTECGGVCDDYMPCSVYNASSSCSGCEEDDDEVCSYFCFTPYQDSDATFLFFVPFGSYVSDEETAARAVDSNYDNELSALSSDYKSYAYSGNDIMVAMGALDLASTVTTFKLIGGGSSTDSLKSKVAYLSFDTGFLTAMSNISTVVLRNFNLQDVQDELPDLLPTSVQDLRLFNGLLHSMPGDLSSFSELTALTLNKNYLTSIASTDVIDTLVTLSLANNNLTSFDAVFPSLESLDLSNNNLTSIPASVYEHSSLTSLTIAGNPFTEAAFTSDEIAFLKNLESLDLVNTDFSESLPCTNTRYVIVHSITVCQMDGSTSSSSSSDAATSQSTGSGSSHTGAIIGGVVGGIVAIALIVVGFLYYRRRSEADKTNGTTGYSAMTAKTWTGPTDGTGFVSLWADADLLAVQVRADDIEDLRRIGGGAYGEVWLVRYRQTQELASKRLRKSQLTRDRTVAFVEEIKLMAKLDHPKIVRFVGAAWSIESDLQALSEYMSNGDLRAYLMDPSVASGWSPLKLQLATDVAEALVYVHSFLPPLVHRDLKSRNVLLSSDMQAKLTDFGSTRAKSEDSTMTQGVGTGRWLAPEVLAGSSDYDQSADIFSFGVLLSELDTHALPYDDARGSNGNRLVDVAILQLVALGQLRPTFEDECPSELKALAARCMAQDPAERPSAPEVAYSLRTLLKSLYPVLE